MIKPIHVVLCPTAKMIQYVTDADFITIRRDPFRIGWSFYHLALHN